MASRQFAHLSRWVLLIIAGSSLVIGAGAGLFMNTYFKTSFAEGEKVETNIGSKIEFSQFLKSQKVDYPWIKNGNFTVKTKVLNTEMKYVEQEDVISVNYDQKYLSIDAACEGEITLLSVVDPSITYHTKFISTFKSNDVERVLMQQYTYIFDDGVATKAELKDIQSIKIDDVATFDGTDLKLLSNIKKVYVTSVTYVTKIDNNTCVESAHFYVPKEKYETYDDLAWAKERLDNVYAVTESPNNASLMLFKNGGDLTDSTGGNIEFLEIPFTSAYTELPTENEISLIGTIFRGWKDKDGVEYDRQKPIMDDLKLYADWEDKDYTVTYHMNDDVTPNYVEHHKYNDHLLIIPDSQVPGSSGGEYVFLGWSLDPTCKNVNYTQNMRFDNYFDDSFMNVDLYAVWAYKVFKLAIYNGTTLASQINCTYGTTQNLPDDIVGDGQFTGITDTKGSFEIQYKAGEEVHFAFSATNEHGYFYIPRNYGTDTMVFYAVFMPIYFPINYKNTDGTLIRSQEYCIDQDTASGKISNGDDIQLLKNTDIAADIIEVPGYHFVGWKRTYLDKSCLFTQETKEFTNFDEVVRLTSENVLEHGYDGKSEVSLYPYYETNLVHYTFSSNRSGATLYNDFTTTYESTSSAAFPGSISLYAYHVGNIIYKTSVSSSSGLKYFTSIRPVEIKDSYQGAFNIAGYTRHTGLPNNTIDVTLSVCWDINTYFVTFIDRNGQSFSDDQYNLLVNHGDNLAALNKVPSNPGRQEDDTYYYDFSRWVDANGNTLDFSAAITTGTKIYSTWNKTKKTCVTGDTLISLSDGSKKMIKDIERGDVVKSLNFETGLIENKPVFLIERNQSTENLTIDVLLDNGTTIQFVYEHDIFIYDTMSYQTINKYNYEEFVGLTTIVENEDELLKSKIIDVSLGEYIGETYTICAAETFNVFTNGVLTLTPNELWRPLFTIEDNLQYDQEEFNSYVESCGLFTYEELKAVVVEYLGEGTFDEEILQYMFYSANAKYFKIGIVKGVYTFEDLMNYMVNDTSNYM